MVLGGIPPPGVSVGGIPPPGVSGSPPTAFTGWYRLPASPTELDNSSDNSGAELCIRNHRFQAEWNGWYTAPRRCSDRLQWRSLGGIAPRQIRLYNIAPRRFRGNKNPKQSIDPERIDDARPRTAFTNPRSLAARVSCGLR